jgi:hypothetical protein
MIPAVEPASDGIAPAAGLRAGTVIFSCNTDQKPKEVRMEPRNDGPNKTPEPLKQPKKGRFQILKLEERIAPGNSSSNGNNCFSNKHSHCLNCST